MTEDDGPPQLTPPRPSHWGLSGHFLFVVGWELAGKGRRPRQVMARVYLKPGFPLEGVGRALEGPGERVLLRDVQKEAEEEEEEGAEEGEGEEGGVPSWTHYSMDACSFVFPVDSRSLDPTVVRTCTYDKI